MDGSIPVAELFLLIALILIFVVAGFVDNQSIRLIILMLGASLTFALILLGPGVLVPRYAGANRSAGRSNR
ncbi:hypothetical protein D3C79_773050 [compost metagenome]